MRATLQTRSYQMSSDPRERNHAVTSPSDLHIIHIGHTILCLQRLAGQKDDNACSQLHSTATKDKSWQHPNQHSTPNVQSHKQPLLTQGANEAHNKRLRNDSQQFEDTHEEHPGRRAKPPLHAKPFLKRFLDQNLQPAIAREAAASSCEGIFC